MKLVTAIYVFFVSITATCLLGAFLVIWSSERAKFHNARVNLAHQSQVAHKSLSNHTYQLFKQYGDALIIGDQDKGAGERELTALIRQDIANIRNIISREIDLVGAEEIEELEQLAIIERKIEGLIQTLEEVAQDSNAETFTFNWTRLSTVLDGEIDRDFRELILAALAEEAREVAETQALADAQLLLTERLAFLFAAAAVLIALGLTFVLHRGLNRPVQRLTTTARRFSEGDFSSRTGLSGQTEIDEVARMFDLMADRVEAKTSRLSDENTVLEQSVAARTRELEALLAEAEASTRNRRRLLADVSHELRTPLTVIQGEADIALRGQEKTGEEYRSALLRARDAASHTAKLVDDLLFVARAEAEEPRLRLEEVDLHTLIAETVATFGPEVAMEASAASAVVIADPTRLRQALLILLENARHHGGANICVRLDATPQGFRLAVEDDGPGMTDAEKESAFQRFFRGSNRWS
ncbi:MAG: histidine kinase dimerization/phospho-acceptor domain-containing protein, partial [Pseudomonadota bacterium]